MINGISLQVDPASLSQKELIALCRAQRQVIRQQDTALKNALDTAALINRGAFEMASQLFALLDSFEAHDDLAVAVHLKELSARRKAKKAEGRVH
jgi:3-dehydroquinate dehydratase